MEAETAAPLLVEDYTFIIYLVGYSLSLVALLIACTAFFYFKCETSFFFLIKIVWVKAAVACLLIWTPK